MGGWQGLEVGKTVFLNFEEKGVGMHQAKLIMGLTSL